MIETPDLSWLPGELAKIKVENGLPPDASCMVCIGCRKVIQSDEHGLLYCDCHDERVGINPNDPSVVVFDEGDLHEDQEKN